MKRALTDSALRGLKPHEAPFKLADGGGLYILAMPNGANTVGTTMSSVARRRHSPWANTPLCSGGAPTSRGAIQSPSQGAKTDVQTNTLRPQGADQRSALSPAGPAGNL